LEADGYIRYLNAVHVSIPLWFDWKLIASLIFAATNSFQFHFGSIGRDSDILTLASLLVSIPLWFDWKYLFANGH